MQRTCLLLALSTLACGKVSPSGGDVDGSPGGDGDGAPAGMQRLTVTVEGGGAVTSDPPGIDCPETCTADFDEGTEVTLTTTPNSDSGLARWDGDCSGLAATCGLTMDASRTAGALFDLHGSARWVEQISFAGTDFLENDVVVGPDGNPIIAGEIDDGNSDLYVAKYDAITGEVLWDTRIVTATANEIYGGLAVDADGNAYATTTIMGFEPVTIEGTEYPLDLGGNIFVFRFAADTGDIDWVQKWGGGGQDRPHGLAVAGTNLLVIAETSSNPSDFNGNTVVASTGDGVLVKARLDNGNATRVKLVDGNVELLGVAVDDTRAAVVGYFQGTPTIDAGCNITSAGTNSPDGFLLQFALNDFDCQWGNDFGDSDADLSTDASGVAAYPGGGWVVTGSFQGSVLFAESGTFLDSRGSYDAFAARYAGNGNHVWSFRYGDTGFDVGRAVAIAPDGATFLAGYFESAITFGGFDLDGAEDVFVTRMSPGNAPTHEWAVALGGDDRDWAEGLAVTADGDPYVLAYFMGMTDVDGEAMTALEYDGWFGALVR